MPLLNFGQPTNGIIQIAFTCADIHQSMREFTERLNIGPWFLFEHFPLADFTYRGQPCDADITLAMGASGHMIFELIQQNNDVPSVYKEVEARQGHGFHHYALSCPDFDASVEYYKGLGYEQALYGVAGVGARAAYMDTTRTLGGMIELIEMTPMVEKLFTTIQLANVGWTGEDPVRTFG